MSTLPAHNKRVVLVSFVGKGNQPTPAHFAVRDHKDFNEPAHPPLEDGQIRLQTLYLSVDPYMRGRMNQDKSYVDPFVPGQPMCGSGVGRIVESKNPSYAVGDILTSQKRLAWPFQEYVVFDAETASHYTRLDPKTVPPQLISATIGWLGMPGLTAYFGMTDRARPKEGETLVVSGAAGACGSVAGQIGKIYNCRVVGIVGSQEKIDYIKQLGFDAGIVYKDKSKEQLSSEIAAACPKGVDIYYDNVGGEISEAVLQHINRNGRVPICGQISQYNNVEMAPLPKDLQSQLEEKHVERGWFMVMNFREKFAEGWAEMLRWANDGRLTCKETVYEGLENVPTAFLGLFKGDNIGKAIIRVSQ